MNDLLTLHSGTGTPTTAVIEPAKPRSVQPVVERHGHIMHHNCGPTWCDLCGTFDVYCDTTPCKPKPENERWWAGSHAKWRV